MVIHLPFVRQLPLVLVAVWLLYSTADSQGRSQEIMLLFSLLARLVNMYYVVMLLDLSYILNFVWWSRRALQNLAEVTPKLRQSHLRTFAEATP